MSVKFSNNATTELASSIGTLNTSITVVDASKFPILTAGDYTYVTLDTDTASPTREIVRVTAVSGNVLTVTRGQDGTSPASFAAGTKVELRLTAALLNDAADITSADVTSALGYTPYNATNPAGYTTNVGTVTSVSGTGTVSGLTLTGSVTSSGSLTLGGTLSLTSGNVTTGLGYTPYNATNPSGYISGNQAITVSGDASGSGATSIALTLANSGVSAGTYTKVTVDAKGRVTTGASLASGDLPTYTGSITSGQVTTGLGYTPLSNATSYLPLSGGTLTGQLTTSYSGARHSITDGTNGITIGLWDGSNIRFEGTGRPMYLVSYGGTVSIGRSSGSNLVVDTSTISYGANALLHAGNYNSYAPTLTGTGASGTWGISVTGNAATATNSTQLGGFSKDYFVYGDTGNTGSVNTYIPDGGIGANAITRSCFFRDNESNFTALGIHIQHANNGGYGVQIGSNYAGTTWLVRAKVAGTWGSSATLLTSGNYSSYALPLSGGTVSGSITATGNVTGGRIVLRDDSLEIHATDNDTAGVAVNYNGYASGTSRFRNFTVYDGKGGNKFQVNGSTGAVTAGGNQVLHAGNYSSGYFKTINGSSIIGTGDVTVSGTDSTKLPLSGGTLTGAIYVGTTGSGSATRALRVGPSGGSPASFGSYTGGWRSTIEIWDNAATRMLHLTPPDGTNYNWSSIKSTDAGLRIDVGGSGGTNAIDIGTNGVANFPQGLQQGGNQVLHAGNYTSYSPSLTGSGASGTWGISITGSAGSASTATRSTIEDTRAGQRTPNAYDDYRASYEFTNQIVGSDWHTAFTMQGWHDAYAAWQIIGPASTSAHENFYLRSGINTTWNAARTILHSGNYTSYSPSLTGSGASGTWGIRITGFANQGTARLYSTDAAYNYDAANPYYGYLTYDGSRWLFQVTPGTPAAVRVAYADSAGSVSNSTTVGGLAPAQFFNNMGNNHGTYTDFNSVPGFGAYYVQAGTNSPTGVGSHQWYGFTLGLGNEYAQSSYASQLYWARRAQNSETYLYVRDREGGGWTGWTKIRAGVADSAGTLGGNAPNQTGGANTIVQRNASGYIENNYFYMSGGGSERGGSGLGYFAGFNSSDYYVRSWTPAAAAASMGALTTGNYTSYSPPYSGGTLSGTWYFNSSRDTTSNSPPLQAYSTGSAGAIMSFHRAGVYAINMGLDSDNVFRIGGWSAGNNRLVMDMSGNLTMAGFIRPTGNVYIDQNYGHGHVGLYDAGRYQGVFFMGDSYKMSADGTSLSNMYGIGWSHPNAGGAAGNLTDHGMLIINNGGFRCAISNSIVASGNITAYSDERLKKNWRDMPDNFVERLAQVRVGCYERIDDGTQQVGVSAQSLQPLLPEAIQTAKDEIGTLSVSYGNAAMASAVELAKELVALKHKVTELEARIH